MKKNIQTDIKSHLDNLKALNGRICKLLEWSEKEYYYHQYKTGVAYLRNYIPNNAFHTDMLIRQGMFWLWWNLHYDNRNATFETAVQMASISKRRELYLHIHDPEILATATTGNGRMLNETYAIMIGEIHDQTLRQ